MNEAVIAVRPVEMEERRTQRKAIAWCLIASLLAILAALFVVIGSYMMGARDNHKWSDDQPSKGTASPMETTTAKSVGTNPTTISTTQGVIGELKAPTTIRVNTIPSVTPGETTSKINSTTIAIKTTLRTTFVTTTSKTNETNTTPTTKSSNTVSNLPTTPLPVFSTSCGEKTGEEPLDLRYFPRIMSKQVRFEESTKHCPSCYNYTYHLTGRDHAHEMFLEQTAEAVATLVKGEGVWAGGHFDLKHKYPFLVFWSDGKVGDSRKSPRAIWCPGSNPDEFIDAALTKYRTLMAKMTAFKVPIVRWKNASACLSVITDYALSPERYALHPLCVTDPAKIFLKYAGKVLVPKFYSQWPYMKFTGHLDLENRAFTNLSAYSRLHNPAPISTPINMTHVVHHRYGQHVGFLFHEQGPVKYIEKLCSHIRYASEKTPGSLLSQGYLTDDTTSRKSFYIDNILNAVTRLQKEGTRYTLFKFFNDPDATRLRLITAGRWNLLHASNYTRTIWQSPVGGVAAATELLDFPVRGFCNGAGNNVTHQLAPIRSNFLDWYKSVGYLTSGPYYVYLAVYPRWDANRNSYSYCMELESENLYWPGARLYVPFCSKERPT